MQHIVQDKVNSGHVTYVTILLHIDTFFFLKTLEILITVGHLVITNCPQSLLDVH